MERRLLIPKIIWFLILSIATLIGNTTTEDRRFKHHQWIAHIDSMILRKEAILASRPQNDMSREIVRTRKEVESLEKYKIDVIRLQEKISH